MRGGPCWRGHGWSAARAVGLAKWLAGLAPAAGPGPGARPRGDAAQARGPERDGLPTPGTVELQGALQPSQQCSLEHGLAGTGGSGSGFRRSHGGKDRALTAPRPG